MTATSAFERAARNRVALGHVLDCDRILAIPRVQVDPLKSAQAWSEALALRPLGDDPDLHTPPLKPVQGALLSAAAEAAAGDTPRGVFGVVGVGGGKTLCTLLFGTVTQTPRPILFIPPDMREQLHRDVNYWSSRYDITKPHVMAYSELSSAKASTFLDYYRPTMIIADECHMLRHAETARTRRVRRYLDEHPDCRVILLSGTATGKGLRDHAHLMDWALREFLPIPGSSHGVDQWASVLDSNGDPDIESYRSMWPLVVAAGGPPAPELVPSDRRQKVAREAYRSRFVTVPGVITTTEMSAPQTLYLRGNRVDVPNEIIELLHRLETTWTLPDPDAVADESGDLLDNALSVGRAAMSLSVGFYYRWKWPNGVRNVEWLERRREFHKAVRDQLKADPAPGRDSPLLVMRWLAMHPEQVPGFLRYANQRWREVSPDGRRWCDIPSPPTETVWVDEFVVKDVLQRLKKAPPTLVWFQSRAFAEVLGSHMKTYGSGSDAPQAPAHHAAVSIAVHSKGKNLQAWSHNLVIEPPSSGSTWEQMLGRTHRMGQKADEIFVDFYIHTSRLTGAVLKAAQEAVYIQQLHGMQQRLTASVWSGIARPAWLR